MISYSGNIKMEISVIVLVGFIGGLILTFIFLLRVQQAQYRKLHNRMIDNFKAQIIEHDRNREELQYIKKKLDDLVGG